MERKNKNRDIINKMRIDDKEGLTVSYDKDELKQKFPHLITEITDRRKFIKIESIEDNSDLNQLRDNSVLHNELTNPRPVDFLRRCTNNNEALEILDFLLNQKEISEEYYNYFKNQILYGDGLKKLIEKYGGFKDYGYYEKKYRHLTRNKLDQNKS